VRLVIGVVNCYIFFLRFPKKKPKTVESDPSKGAGPAPWDKGA